MNLIESNGQSPVNQDFIWMVDYLDGTHLSEFDLDTKAENSFYDINQDNWARFGLLGHGMKFYFERDGVFYLNGTAFEVKYVDEEGKEYALTGLKNQPRDLISFKDAESALLLQGGSKTRINKFNVGYKANLLIHGVGIKFQAICMIPFNEPVYMNLRMVADQTLNGKFIVKKNNKVVAEMEAPLTKNKGGEVNVLA